MGHDFFADQVFVFQSRILLSIAQNMHNDAKLGYLIYAKKLLQIITK